MIKLINSLIKNNIMENKINVAELLKDCPRGMELDCAIWDNCTFDGIKDVGYINILVKTPNGLVKLSKEGHLYHNHSDAKCVIFPKGKTTWEGFVPPCKFKDGDILVDNIFPFIYKDCDKTEIVKSHCGIDTKGNFWKASNRWTTLDKITFATEEQKEKLYKAIKDNGYRWNPETKKLEKLIESKKDTNVKVVMSGICFNREYYADEVELYLGNYEIEVRDGRTYAVFKNQETKISKPKFKVGDKIKKKNSDNVHILEITAITPKTYIFRDGSFQYVKIIDKDYKLVPNKFDITTLEPFESRVLVRNADNYLWKPAIYGFSYQKGHYIVGGSCWKQCIPYESNEHLIGTTNDCNDFYKNWE